MGKRKYQLVYLGRDFNSAEQAGLQFWKRASAQAKADAMRELVEQAAMMKGIPPHALRLLKSTAIIKRDSLNIPVVSRAGLAQLKRLAGRPQDIVDLAKLSPGAKKGRKPSRKSLERSKTRIKRR